MLKFKEAKLFICTKNRWNVTTILEEKNSPLIYLATYGTYGRIINLTSHASKQFEWQMNEKMDSRTDTHSKNRLTRLFYLLPCVQAFFPYSTLIFLAPRNYFVNRYSLVSLLIIILLIVQPKKSCQNPFLAILRLKFFFFLNSDGH